MATAALPAALAPYSLPLVGGLALGTLSLGKLALNGKVLGISGTVKGIVQGDRSVWRLLFLGGLVAGGACLNVLYPAAWDPPSVLGALSVPRIIAAGLAVGAGTALSNGCTSGHGICGNARLSPRSLASTLTFMAAGAISAAAFNTAGLQGVPQGLVTPPTPSASQMTFALSTLASAVALVTSVGVAASAFKVKSQWLEPLADLGTGFLFALGLGAAGMTQPSKVSSFLAVLAGSWNPALAFVMGGALLVALPGYQLVMRTKVLPKPLMAMTYQLPTASVVDPKLLGGSALFGAGWGAAGLCPGPAIVSLATLQPMALVFVASLVTGMVAAQKLAG